MAGPLLLCVLCAAATAPWPGGQRRPSMQNLKAAFCHKVLPVAGPAAALSCPTVLQMAVAGPLSGERQQGPRGLLMLLDVPSVTQHPQSRPGERAAWLYLLPHPSGRRSTTSRGWLTSTSEGAWASSGAAIPARRGGTGLCLCGLHEEDSCGVGVGVWECVPGACLFVVPRLQGCSTL